MTPATHNASLGDLRRERDISKQTILNKGIGCCNDVGSTPLIYNYREEKEIKEHRKKNLRSRRDGQWISRDGNRGSKVTIYEGMVA